MLAEADTSEANSYLASHISMQIHMEQVAQLDQNETAQLQNMCYKRSKIFIQTRAQIIFIVSLISWIKAYLYYLLAFPLSTCK